MKDVRKARGKGQSAAVPVPRFLESYCSSIHSHGGATRSNGARRPFFPPPPPDHTTACAVSVLCLPPPLAPSAGAPSLPETRRRRRGGGSTRFLAHHRTYSTRSSPPYENPTPSDAMVSQADTERRKHELLRAVQETRRGFAAGPDQRAAIEEAVVRRRPNRPLSL